FFIQAEDGIRDRNVTGVQTCALPIYIFILHKETRLYLLYPKFTLWYLMALFVWKLATPLVMKIPFHLIFAVAAGLWVGSSGLDEIGRASCREGVESWGGGGAVDGRQR